MHVSEVAIFTDQVAETAAFYERVLGRPPEYAGEGIALFRAGATTILIHATYSPGPDDLPCENHVALAVTDLDAEAERLGTAGIELAFPPRTYPWGRSAYLRDPGGLMWELSEVARQEQGPDSDAGAGG